MNDTKRFVEAKEFHREYALDYPNHSFGHVVGLKLLALPQFVRNVVEKLAEGVGILHPQNPLGTPHHHIS